VAWKFRASLSLGSDGRSQPEGIMSESARRPDQRDRLAKRVSRLNEEVDLLLADATQREASVNGKASFLAVSAGIIIAASTTNQEQHVKLLALMPLILALLSLVFAALALLPGKRPGTTPEKLVDGWLERDVSPGRLAKKILLKKARDATRREADLHRRALITSVGFGFLLLAGLATIIFYAVPR
jgi:hypothetical protein